MCEPARPPLKVGAAVDQGQKEAQEENAAYGWQSEVRCDACAVKARREWARGSKARHRAMKRKTRTVRVSVSWIFARDGYRCQQCGKKTRGDYDPNHDLYPNLDHIIPLAVGGTHTPGNLQCLCRACNIAKGADPTGAQPCLELY